MKLPKLTDEGERPETMCEVYDMIEQKGIAKGIEKGRKEGRKEGIHEGETLLASLINKLLSLGRNDDVAKVTTDQAFREKLYLQFGLKESV